MAMELSMCLCPIIEMRLCKPHHPINNPRLTSIAEYRKGNLERVIKRGMLDKEEKMLEVEASLLKRWEYCDNWRSYLDMPLIAHAYAAVGLKELGYDGVVGINELGIPYADIFMMMGFDVFSIDYSHHKRKMIEPKINEEQLEQLRTKNKILLTDIDIVTGKTIKTVTNYLKKNCVNVTGVYIGLSEWSGTGFSDIPYIGSDVIDFKNFWKICGKTRQLKSKFPYINNILSNDLKLFTGDISLDKPLESSFLKGATAARQIAEFLLRNGSNNNPR